MRKTASEILYDLEVRVASLEEDSALESLRQMAEDRMSRYQGSKVTLRKGQKKVGIRTPFATFFIRLEGDSYRVSVDFTSVQASNALALLEGIEELNDTIKNNGGVKIGLLPLGKLKGTEGSSMDNIGVFINLLKQRYGRNVGYSNYRLTANLGYMTYSFASIENDGLYAIPQGLGIMLCDNAPEAIYAVESVLKATVKLYLLR
jgi:hypothetical protein